MRHPALVALLFALTLAVPVRAEEVQRYGASITETRSVALAKLVRKPRTYIGRTLRIEGTVKDGPRICGGIVLEPIKISPLAELDGTCNTILPVEDQYTVPFAPRVSLNQ